MRKELLVYGSPTIESAEIDEVIAVMQSGWLGIGPRVTQFEKDFAVYKGIEHAVALHRYENICSRSALERIVDIVERIAQQKSLLFILDSPTRKKLMEYSFYNRLAASKNIEFRKRYDYFRFTRLISAADFLVSDGGSNQEECYYLGKPVLLLRKSTERQEGLDENCILSKYEPNTITYFLDNWKSHRRNPQRFEYSASEIIVNYCENSLRYSGRL